VGFAGVKGINDVWVLQGRIEEAHSSCGRFAILQKLLFFLFYFFSFLFYFFFCYGLRSVQYLNASLNSG
jgi:hypothetical protein